MNNKKTLIFDDGILNIAKAFKEAGLTKENVFSIKEGFFSTPQLEAAMLNPAIDLSVKNSIIRRIFENQLEARCIMFLLSHNKINYLEQILFALDQLYLNESGTVSAKLSYTSKLPHSNQLQDMENHILSTYKCQDVCWDFVCDPQLLGGFTLEVDGDFYDYSLKGKYDKLLNHLIRR